MRAEGEEKYPAQKYNARHEARLVYPVGDPETTRYVPGVPGHYASLTLQASDSVRNPA